MLWITRSHVHVDRVACPWLIRRFVDVELGDHDGKCSFETIIEKYSLTDPGLLRLAKIVHAADIAEDLHTDAIAPGLEAIASGFSLILPDDRANLERQFVVYDALYAWRRLQAQPPL
jgi:hypothetical protein